MFRERFERWRRSREQFPSEGSPAPRREHFEACQDRDDRIIDLATRHVIVPRHVFGLFPGPSPAYRRLAKLRERRRLRHRGTVQLRGGGRPQDVYANGWNPDPRCLLHEVYLSDLLLCYDGEADIVRDPRRVNQRFNSDAELKFRGNGRFFRLEFDTGSEDLATVEKQFRAYRYTSDFLLVVTLAEVRKRHLIERAECIKEIALFAMLDAVLAEPHGSVFVDWFGNSAAI
jgi:hypothetical protein